VKSFAALLEFPFDRLRRRAYDFPKLNNDGVGQRRPDGFAHPVKTNGVGNNGQLKTSVLQLRKIGSYAENIQVRSFQVRCASIC
jgi:hypothetical protein